MGRWTGKSCRLSVMLSLTFSFFIVEIITGYITKSTALVADSFHMLSDVLALIVAFVCMKMAKRRSSQNTFGWVRAEVLGALVNAVFLLALCFSIFIESLKRLSEPELITDPIDILIVGSVGFLVNMIGIFMFHGHASMHGHSHGGGGGHSHGGAKAEEAEVSGFATRYDLVAHEAHNISIMADPESGEYESATEETESTKTRDTHLPASGDRGLGNGDAAQMADPEKKLKLNIKSPQAVTEKKAGASAAQLNMHGVFLHILGDALGSVIVMINAVVMWQINNDAVRKYLDPSLSLIMVLIIASTTIPLLKESALILLQTVPTHINVRDIKARLLQNVEGVHEVHEFHVWRLAGNKIIASAHITCRDLDDYMKVAEQVKQFFHNEGIHSTTIQPEFVASPSLEDVKTKVSMTEFGDQVLSDKQPLVKNSCQLPCPDNDSCSPTTRCCPTEDANGKAATVTATNKHVV